MKEPTNALIQTALLVNIIMDMNAKLLIVLLHHSSMWIDVCTKESTNVHSAIIGMAKHVYTTLLSAQPEQLGLVFLANQTASAEMDITLEILVHVQVSLNNVLPQQLSTDKDVLVQTMLVQMELMPMEIDVFLMFLAKMDSSGTQLILDVYVLQDKSITETPALLAQVKRYGLQLKDAYVHKEALILERLVKKLAKVDVLSFLMQSGNLMHVSVEMDLLKLASNVSAMEPKQATYAQSAPTNPTQS